MELRPGNAGADNIALSRYSTGAAPGRVVVSGEQAFVAWHGDGLRLIDLGLLEPQTVAQFSPPDGDVTSVALLPSKVVVVARTAGLYVLARPQEGQRESFWTKMKNASGPIAIGGVLLLTTVVPRVAAALSAVTARRSRPVPVTSGSRRR